jgi:hypothetical protein
MRFKAIQLADAGRYACCINLEDGTEQCHSITLMVYDTTAHADFLQDMAAAHVPGVIERREDVPTAGDSYSYELDPTRQLDNADVMLRGGVSYLLRHEVDGKTSNKRGFISCLFIFRHLFLLSEV